MIGGARRDRTADLLHAMQALSQLSYSPTQRERELTQTGQRCQPAAAVRNLAECKPVKPNVAVAAIDSMHVTRIRFPVPWAVSSAVEHCFHTAGVTGSIPVPPTIQRDNLRQVPDADSIGFGTSQPDVVSPHAQISSSP